MSKPHLVVVGGGPAGMAAAGQAACFGMAVTVLDESAALGGQYFRGRQDSKMDGSPGRFLDAHNEVEVLLETLVVDAPMDGQLSIWNEARGVLALPYDALIIATGAYDRPVALPGWTLPGVFTAGGASTLAKAYGVTPGHRLLVAGSGPFLLSVADDLSIKGCQVEVIEATPLSTSIRGLPIIARDPEIMRQTLGFLTRLSARRVRRRYGHIVTSIHGQDRVEAATIQKVDDEWRPVPSSEKTIAVDGVCLGFGFVPQLELAQALECAIDYDEAASEFSIRIDDSLRTSRPRIYAAGEVTGIGGVRGALAEGQLAGLTSVYDAGLINSETYTIERKHMVARLAHIRPVANWLRQAYRPRSGLWSLAESTTMLCRCEDVTLATAEAALANNPPTPYAVKTATRAGMGLCQGRICSPYLIEWLRARHNYRIPRGDRPWRIRPPLRPVPLGDWLAPEVA